MATIGFVVDAAGSRTFGPLLVLGGLVVASPASGIPGVSSIVGLAVLLIAVQVLMGRRHLWLPRWMLQRSIPVRFLQRSLERLEPAVGKVDLLFRPRLSVLVGPKGTIVISFMCAVIAGTMPAMELIPFTSTMAGMALCAFGLALVVGDGLLALVAMCFTMGGVILVAGALI